MVRAEMQDVGSPGLVFGDEAYEGFLKPAERPKFDDFRAKTEEFLKCEDPKERKYKMSALVQFLGLEKEAKVHRLDHRKTDKDFIWSLYECADEVGCAHLWDDMLLSEDVITPRAGMQAEGRIGRKSEIPKTQLVVRHLSENNIAYNLVLNKRTARQKNLGAVVFVLPQKDKMIIVSNQGEAATYIVHRNQKQDDWKNFSKLNRFKLKALESSNVVTSIRFESPKQWTAELTSEIESPSVDLDVDVNAYLESQLKKTKKPGYLSMKALSKELRLSEVKIKRGLRELLEEGEFTLEEIEEELPDRGGRNWCIQYSPDIQSALRKKYPETQYPRLKLPWRSVG